MNPQVHHHYHRGPQRQAHVGDAKVTSKQAGSLGQTRGALPSGRGATSERHDAAANASAPDPVALGQYEAHQLAALELEANERGGGQRDQLREQQQRHQVQQQQQQQDVRELTRLDKSFERREAPSVPTSCSVGRQAAAAAASTTTPRANGDQLNHCAAVSSGADHRPPQQRAAIKKEAQEEEASGGDTRADHGHTRPADQESSCGVEQIWRASDGSSARVCSSSSASSLSALAQERQVYQLAAATVQRFRTPAESNSSAATIQVAPVASEQSGRRQQQQHQQRLQNKRIAVVNATLSPQTGDIYASSSIAHFAAASDSSRNNNNNDNNNTHNTNTEPTLIDTNDNLSFWRRLSNLSCSIIHQQQRQQQQDQPQQQQRWPPLRGRDQLAPEVEGYLRKNQLDCKYVVSGKNQQQQPHQGPGQSTMTASERVALEEDAGEVSRVRIKQKELIRMGHQRTIQEQQLNDAEEEGDGDEEAAGLLPGGHDGHQGKQPPSPQQLQQLASEQKLIKIVEMPASTKAREGLSGEAPPQALGARLNQIKLSITTTTNTTNTTNTATRLSGASSLSSCILSDSSSLNSERLKWGKKMDFLLSIIGFAVDLANIWRFPYLVYKNGGGVFLIPYLTMLIFGGIPLFFLELCLGQFVKKGPITVWNKICPYMKGVGYCSILISWYVSFYYNVLIAWSVYFIYRSISSFGEKMPWEDCDNSWNTKSTCVSISQLKQLCSTRNETLESCRKDMFSSINVTSPASEFFVKELSQIDQSTGLEDMGYLRYELVICTIIVYLLHYCSLFRGLETSGKVVWVTATAPYMILSILLVRGLFLPGASMGIEYYLSPKMEKLADPQVWIDAAGQVFYSIGVGFGVHLTYASFNSHDNNCYRDCLMTSAVNALTSVYSGLVVFVYLGYMATNLGIEIDKVASEGYSLVFEVYPEALTTLPFARFWSILFFIMLLTLGIDSAMGGLEAVITGLEDEFKFAKRLSRGQLTGLVIFSSFLPALISCTQGGAYTLFWFDIYSAGVSLLFSALFETIGVVYCYGLDKFILNIESMLGRKPQLFYILCWKYISPSFLMGIIFMSIYTASVPVYRGYTFPVWSIVLGWCLAFSSVAAVPIVAIYTWYSKGSKATSVSPSKSPRKPGGSRNSAARKTPIHDHFKTISVNYGAEGAIQSGLSDYNTAGQLATTNIISSPNVSRIKEEML